MANRRYNSQTVAEPLGDAKGSQGAMTDGVPWEDAAPGDLLALDVNTRTRLERLCREAVDSWIRSSDTRHANLRRWNDLVEGVVYDTNFPWDGASNLSIHLTAIHLVTLHSVMARSITTVDPLWYARGTNEVVLDQAAKIEESLNYKAKHELNILEATRDVLYTTGRDGLGWLNVIWSEETEEVESVFRATSIEHFQSEFPDAESAGLSPEEYEEVKVRIAATASEETPYEVRVSFERVDYRGPKAFVVDEADMVRAPMTADTVKKCRVYGKRYYERAEDLKAMAKDGKLWSAAVKSFCANAKTNVTYDAWKRSREAIDGIKDDQHQFSDERELFNLVCRFHVVPGEKEKKVLVTYSHEQKRVLGAVKYPYLRDCYIPFRIMRRPGRMAGVSVPERLEALNAEIDASVNYEINSNAIEMAPMFKGKKSAKEDADLELEENWIRLGKVFWLDDPKDFEQFKIAANDKNAAKAMRQELIRYAEMEIGPTQLLSGQESKVDPNAPGNKTIALIQQSNMRIEDYINEFRLGFNDLGDMIVSLYYQFGEGLLQYRTKDGKTDELKRDILRGMPKMAMAGVTVNLNPEVEFEKAFKWFEILMPLYQNDPVKRQKVLEMVMVAGRLPNRDALLETEDEAKAEELKQLEAEIEKKAIGKMLKNGMLKDEVAQRLMMPPMPPGAPVGPAGPVPAPAMNGAMGA